MALLVIKLSRLVYIFYLLVNIEERFSRGDAHMEERDTAHGLHLGQLMKS